MAYNATKNTRIAALVPMRHHSERAPGKNYRAFGGKPLYRHVIEQLLKCPEINEVFIDTDSPVIMEDAARQFPAVRVYERPEHLRDGKIAMNDILLNDVQHVHADFYLQTHSTNPLLRSETIRLALGQFLEHYPGHDSLFSVTRLQSRLWDDRGKALNHDPAILVRTQDLPPIYEENSCLYIFARAMLESRRTRIGERPLMFIVDRIEAWDIDDEEQFQIAEALYVQRQQRAKT